RFIADARLSDDLAFRLAIVVEELITNLVEHGEALETRANLRIGRRGDGVEICLADRGIAFDPRHSVASDHVPERGGGAGVMLILAWATVRSYRRARGTNRLHLFLPAIETSHG
ncbi:MAG: ATP-binding protein, partial [Sphingomonas sp.]